MVVMLNNWLNGSNAKQQMLIVVMLINWLNGSNAKQPMSLNGSQVTNTHLTTIAYFHTMKTLIGCCLQSLYSVNI